MGRLKALFGAFRAYRGMSGAEQQALVADAESMRAAAERGETPDIAAHMRQLAQAGLVCQPTLKAGDPRLQPIAGM